MNNNKVAPIQSLDELPQAVRDFVLSEEFVKKLRGVTTTFGLSKNAQDKIGDAHYGAVMGEMELNEFFKIIQSIATKELKSPEDLTNTVVRDLLFPINDYFGGEPRRLLDKAKPAPAAYPWKVFY